MASVVVMAVVVVMVVFHQTLLSHCFLGSMVAEHQIPVVAASGLALGVRASRSVCKFVLMKDLLGLLNKGPTVALQLPDGCLSRLGQYRMCTYTV